MERDFAQFPADDNGDKLWNMRQGGDRLVIPREVDFAVVFSTEEVAMEFAVLLLHYGQKVSFGEVQGVSGYAWQVQAHPVMVPTHHNVGAYARRLAQDAEPLGGRNQGWGCFARD